MTKLFPKVLEIFKGLLQDPLYTTCYIFGFHFNYLCFFDFDWVKRNIEAILPTDAEKLDYFEAAWAGYLDDHHIVKPNLVILKPYYLYSLNWLNKKAKLISFSMENLINQIALLYVHGYETLEDKESLVSIFFNTAPNSYRKIFIRSLGNNLGKYKEEDDYEKIKERLINLLEFRLECAKSGDLTEFIEELQGFTFWFINSIFDKEWMINHYLEILQILKDPWSTFILDSLIDYVVDFPLQTIECLIIISNKEAESGYLTFEDKYREILKMVLESDNDDAKKKAIDHINHLLKLNYHAFRDLLKS